MMVDNKTLQDRRQLYIDGFVTGNCRRMYSTNNLLGLLECVHLQDDRDESDEEEKSVHSSSDNFSDDDEESSCPAEDQKAAQVAPSIEYNPQDFDIVNNYEDIEVIYEERLSASVVVKVRRLKDGIVCVKKIIMKNKLFGDHQLL